MHLLCGGGLEKDKEFFNHTLNNGKKRAVHQNKTMPVAHPNIHFKSLFWVFTSILSLVRFQILKCQYLSVSDVHGNNNLTATQKLQRFKN